MDQKPSPTLRELQLIRREIELVREDSQKFSKELTLKIATGIIGAGVIVAIFGGLLVVLALLHN